MVYAVKLLVSVMLIAFLAYRFDISAAVGQLSSVDIWPAMTATGLYMFFHAVNAAKLQILLSTRRFGTIFALVLMAQAYALVLPGQLAGEAMKAYRLTRGVDHKGRVVSSVAFDKLMSLAALLLVTLGGVLVELHRFGATLLAASVGGLALIAAMAAVPGLGRFQALLRRGLGERGGWRGRLSLHIGHFFDTWRAHIREPRRVAVLLLAGVAAQLVQALATQLLGWGLGIDLSLALWCVVTGALTIILLAPVTIGGLGLREASLVGMLGLCAVPQEQALAMAFAILAIQLLTAAIGLAVDLLLLRGA